MNFRCHEELEADLKNYIISLQTSDCFADRVKLKIIESLNDDFSMPAIAELLHMSGTTLSRRLAECETQFSKVLTLVRLELGRLYLEGTTLEIQMISKILGYKSEISFGRLFARELGVNARLHRGKFNKIDDSNSKLIVL